MPSPQIKLYNSLTRKLDSLPKRARGPLRIFVCGLTVYDTPHIGNIRTYLVFDAFAKYLRSRGIKVNYLQNITDIDDKILQRSRDEKTSWKIIAKRYTTQYKKVLKVLRIDSIDTYAPATSYIKEIIEQIEDLIKKGYVYEIKGDGFYFNITKFEDYGKLAGRTVAQAEDSMSRIDDGIAKRNKGDFCVWKLSTKPEPGWNTSLGYGRPGWHIEDTAIAFKFFGSQYEIHGGGIDLKFPHHEAEIALAEAFSGKKPYVKLWMHTGHLTVANKKMSKSLKNFVTAEEFLEKYSGNIFRLMILSHHYRSPLNYTEDSARNFQKAWWTVEDFFRKLDFVANTEEETIAKDTFYASELKVATTRFEQALAQDFNTPVALSEFYKLSTWLQPRIWQMSKKEARRWKKEVMTWFDLLGFKVESLKIPGEVKKMAEEREATRRIKEYVEADRIRNEMAELGYRADDTPRGQYVGRLLD